MWSAIRTQGLKSIGFLRWLMLGLGTVLVVLSWFTDQAVHYEGWRFIPSVISPVLVVLLAWGLLFDMLMSTVFLSSGEGKSPEHYRLVLTIDAWMIAIMLIFWLPYYWSVLS
jgi:uncharacterized membrane protein